MTKPVLCPRTRPIVFSAVILALLLALNLPLLAAGPRPAQDATSGPRIWLQENQPLPVIHRGAAAKVAGQAQPVSITSGDLDADGFDDLIVGYRTSSGGFISVHRGNIDAFAPQSDASFQAITRGEFPSPFHLEAQTFNVPISPDFIAVGNFIGNGNNDLAVAARGGSVIYLFPGDGQGGFGNPQSVNVGSDVTALGTGELGTSYTPVLVVGGPRSLAIYVSTPQGLTALASYALNAPASNILFGDFGDSGPDIAFLSGGRVQILRSATMQIATISLPVSARAFALGTFLWDRNRGSEIALVAPDGSVQIAVRNDFDPRVYTNEQFAAIRQANRDNQPPPAFVPQPSFPSGWKVVESFAGAAGVGASQAPIFFRTRVSSNGADDVMVLNAFSGQLALISHPDAKPGDQTFLPGQVSLRPYSGTPIAALPLRINVDGRPGVMALHQGEIAPSMIMPIPDPTFTVNTTSDILNTAATFCLNGTPNKCSLRQAVWEANHTAGTDTISVPAGTYTLTISKVVTTTSPYNPDCSGQFGALYINDSVNIVGAGQSTTIIQAGTTAYNAGTANGVDFVMSVNEDEGTSTCPLTAASATVSNLTLENGHNLGKHSQDGDGGCMEFDTGSAGTATLALTNVTLQNCNTTQGNGGGLANFNTKNNTGMATIINSIIQGNEGSDSVVSGGSSGGGIFAADPSRISMTNTQILNNIAGTGAGNGLGGGLRIFSKNSGSRQTVIHSSTISGNTSTGSGGGVWDSSNLLIDQGTIIRNNTGGTGNIVNSTDGGGVLLNPKNPDSVTLTKVTITGNSAANGNGGGISIGNLSAGFGTMTMSFSRLAGNTSVAGSNLNNIDGTVTATDNWWGTNSASGTVRNDPGGATPTTATIDPFIVLTNTASPNLIRIGDTSALTADFLHDNHGTAITASNLDVFAGVPVIFNGSTTSTAPLHGSISNAQPFIEGQVNISTVSESGCASPPVVPCTATVTVTTSTAHGFSNGQTVTIAGVTDPTYDGVFPIVTTPTTTTFTYSTSDTGTTSSSGGTASVPKGTATATYTATSGGIDTVNAFVDQGAAPATITVLFPPQIAKQFSVTHIPIFTFSPTTAQLTFTITNPNTANALHGLAFTDNLPSGLQIADTTNTNTCGGSLSGDTAGSTSISYSGGTISFNAGGTFTCTVTVDVKGVTDGVQNNTSGNVTATDVGGLTGNFATASITVINPPSITKAFTLHSIPLNGSTTLTFTLSNSNANTILNGIAFNDTLPSTAPGTLVVSTPSNLNSTCNGTPSASPGSGSVSLTGASLAAGASCTVTVSVTGTVAGSAPNSVTPTATNVGGLTGPASSDTVLIVAPPSIAKSFSPKSVPLNSNSTLSFTLTNPNTGSALSGVAFTDSLPGGVKLASTTVTGSCGSGTITATINNPPGSPSTVSLSGGTLTASPGAGSSCTFSVSVTGISAGTQVNTTSTVSSTEGGTGSTATDTLTVVAPPTISKSFSPKSVPLNSNSTLSFTVTNPNTASALSGVAFTDSLPAGTKLASTTVTGSCGSGTITATINNPPGSPSTVSLSGGTLTASPAAGSSCTFSVSVKGISAGAQVNTTSTVSSTEGGTGGTASDTLTVVAPPTITKSFSPKSVPLNGNSTLSFTVTNPNTLSALSGVAFTDSLPGGLKLASTTVTGSCGSGTITATINNPPGSPSTVSLSGGTLTASPAAGSSCTFSVSVTGISAGAQVNTTSTVSSTEGGTGGTGSDTLTVVAPPTISKHFGHTTVPLNQSDTLSFTVTNPNTLSALSGVAFTDSLPGGLKLASTTVTGSCGSGTITATINNPPGSPSTVSLSGGTLTASPSAGSSCTFSVSITGISAGAQVNTTSTVSSTEGGTGGTATDTITVVAPPTTTKVFNPTTISVGGTSTMTITITNPSATVGLTGVGFTDTFPANLVVATPNGLSNTCNGTPAATAGSGTVSLTGGTIAANSSCAVTVKVTSSVSGNYLNSTGAISSTEGGNGAAATATLTVASPPTITKSFSPKSIPLNGSSTLSFTVTNPNTASALSGVAFTDSLPGGVKLASTIVTGSCGSGTITATINNPPGSPSTVSLSGGTLTASPAAGSSCTFSVSVTGISAGAQVNTTSTVSSTEGGTGGTATDTLTVIAPPTISKHFGHTTVPLNQSDTLSFTVTNPNTTGGLSGVAFTDSLPGGLKLASTTVTGSCGSGTITATINNPPGSPSTVSLSGGTLTASPGAGSSCTFSVSITGISAGAQVNTTSTVSSTEGGTGGTATDTITVVAPPTTTKVFNPTTISVGGTSTMTITITNPSATVGLTGVGFTDTFPANLVVATPNGLSNTCNGTPTATAGSGTVSLTGGTIAANSSCAVTVKVTSSVSGNYLNSTGAISSTEGGNGAAATATLTVASPPTISKSFSPKSIPLNGNSTLSFTLNNPNNNVSLSGISFTDSLPGGVMLASTTVIGSCGSGTITATINNPPGSPSTVSLSGGTLASSGSCTFSVSVTGISAGAQVNTTSTVSSTEGGTGGTATDTLTVIAPPTISKHFGHTTVPLNQSDTLSFTVTNPNTTSALSGVAFTDSLPGGLKLASTTVTGSCGSGTITATINNPPGSPSTVSLSGGTLTASPGAGSSCTFSVGITGISAGAQVNTTSTVSSTEGGTGGTATDTITVVAPPTTTKVFNPTTISVGGTSTMTITITNPSATVGLTGVGFTDTFPANLVVATPNGLNNTCNGTPTATAGSGTVSLTGGTIAANTSCAVTVNVTSSVSGNYLNSTGAISSTEGGNGAAATATLTVASPPTITKSFSPKSIPLNGNSTLSFTLTNPNNNVTLSGISFTDSLPGGVELASTTVTGSCGSGTITATINNPPGSPSTVSLSGGTLASSGSCTFSVSVTGISAGAQVNTTSTVSSTEGGTGLTATDTLNVVAPPTISKSFSPPGTVMFDGITTVTFTINNPNTISAGDLTGIGFTDTLPSSTGTLVVAPTPNISTTCGGGTGIVTATAGSGVITVSGGSLAHNSSCTISVDLQATAVGDASNTTGAITSTEGGTGATSNTAPMTVIQATTTTTVAADQGTITLGDTVTFTATVTASGGTPTGIVTFFDGNTPLGSAPLNGTLGNDQATFPTSLLSAAGSPHSITAIYQGSTDFAVSPLSSPISETVNTRTSTTGVVLNPTTVVVGQSSTATVTLTDSGSVPPGTADTFATTGAPATGRTGFTSTLFANGLVLVAGGTDANNNVLNSAEIYSVSNGTFSSTGNLNTARTGAVAVLLPTGKVLVAGGSSDGTANGALNTAELFDPNAGTFAVAGSGSSNTMTAARFGATATLLNTGKVLIAGGVNSGGVLNSAELYDPVTDKFTATGNLNAARSGASATLLGTGKVLVAGGSSDGTANGALNSAELFDPAGNAGAGTFTSVAGANPTLSGNRWQPEAALLLSGKVLIAGGQNSGGALTSADLYDPAADSFTASGQSMSQARANGSAVALPSGMVLLAGGTTSQAVDLYDADSDRFNATGSLQQSDAGLVSTLLNNGRVLVVGLTTAVTPASDAELYSPSFNPLGTVAVTSSEATDNITGACTLTPSTSTASTCTSTVTPANVAASPHTITGTYPADAVHSGSSNTASLTVNKADTTTTITANTPNPSVVGQPVTISASVTANAPGSGTPTGTVTVSDGVGETCTITLISGSGSCQLTPVAAGTDTLTAHYNGDVNFNASTSAGVSQTVNKADTTTTITGNTPNPSVVGQPVTISASVTANSPGSGTPTGTVTVSDGVGETCTITLISGSGSCQLTPVAAGTDTLTAHYNGDVNFNASTSAGVSQTVNKANTTTTITANTPNPSVVGQAVSVSASVTVNSPGSGTPTGTVTVSDGVGETCTITLSGGTGSCQLTPVAAGTDTLTAHYNGDVNFNASTSAGVSQTVNKANTTTTITANTPNPSVVGQPVTISASVTANAPGSGTPTGTVTVNDGVGETCTITLSGGTGSCQLTPVAPGTDTLTASYNGDSNYNTSTSAGVSQTVNKANTATTLTSSPNPSVFGQPVTFTATVSAVPPGAGTPMGTVTFKDNGVTLGTGTLSGGVATFTTSALAVGNHPITTDYPGDSNFNGNTGTLSPNPNQVVNKADTTTGLTSSPNPAALGQAVTFTATVSPVPPGAGTPMGTVTFFDGGNSMGTGTLSGGVATFTTSALSAGNHNITATYGGDGNFNGSTGSLTGNPQVIVAPPVIAKAFNPNGIPVNGTSALTFTITNPAANTVAEQGVAFNDSLPSGLVVATPNGLSNTCGGTPTATAGSGTISLTGGTVAVNSNCTVTVNVTSSQAGIYTNTSGNVSSTNGGTGNTASDTLTVAAPPTIHKDFGASAVGQNSTVGVSFTISNSNTTVTLTGISFTDTLPAGLVVATPNQVTDTCGGTVTANPGSGTITFTGGSLAPAGPPPMIKVKRANITGPSNPVAQGTCVITVNLLVTGTGTLSNTTGPISANESGPGTVSNTATLEVVQAPTVNKAFGAASIPLNGTTSLTFNIANPNSSTALVGIALNDPLPAGLVVANPNGLTGSCIASSDIAANPGSGSINLSSLNLPAGGSCSFSVNVTGTAGGTKNNATSKITATFDDGTGTFRPVTGGSATASIFVVAPPVISKFFLPAAIAPNGTAALTFGITNPSANTVAETGVAFTDTLPANVVVATPNGLSGSCGGTVTAVAGTGVISLSGGTIPPGSSGNSCSFTVNVTSSVTGTFTNTTGAVSSTNGGTGNTASATLTVAHANLSITKTHSGNFPRNSTGNNYTIVVSNAASAGPTDGTTVTVTDTLPNVQNTLVPTAMSGTGWTCNLGTLTCTRNDVLAPGGSYPAITLTVTVPQNIQANVTNSATVSGGGDPNSHTANDPTHIGPPIEIKSDISSLTVSHNNPSSMDFTVNASPGMGNITFSCGGLPFGASCIFNPPSESQLSATVTMTVITTGNHARVLPPGPNSTPPIYALLFPLLGLLGLRGWNGRRAQNRRAVRVRIAMAFAGLLLLLALAGCGGGTGFTGTPGGTFQIQVTATSQSTGQSGSTTVTLTVLD